MHLWPERRKPSIQPLPAVWDKIFSEKKSVPNFAHRSAVFWGGYSDCAGAVAAPVGRSRTPRKTQENGLGGGRFLRHRVAGIAAIHSRIRATPSSCIRRLPSSGIMTPGWVEAIR